MTTSIREKVIGGSRFLTLEYVFAIGASLLAAKTITEAIKACFALWNNTAVSTGLPLNLFYGVSNGYVGAISLGIAGVVLSVVAFLLYQRVTREIATRPLYTSRQAYKITTYVAFGVMAAVTGLLAIDLVAIMLTSLLLIGSESSISQLYLDQFLPSLLALIVNGIVAYAFYKIVKGQNVSRLLSLALLGFSSLVLLTLIITVAIRAHDGYTSNDYGRIEREVERDSSTQPALDDWYWGN